MKKEKNTKLNEAWNRNLVDANRQISKAGLIIAGLLSVVWILMLTRVFAVRNTTLANIVFPIIIFMLVVPYFANRFNKNVNQDMLKFFEIFNYAIVVALLNLVIPKHGILAWASIILLASHYYSRKTTVVTFIITAVLMAGMIPLCMLFGEWDGNLMGITDTTFMHLNEYFPEHPLPNGGTDPYNLEDRLYFLSHFDYYSTDLNRWIAAFTYYYMARLLCLSATFVLAIGLNSRTEVLLVSESEAQEEKGRISAELNVASNIQLSALPQSFPKINKFDIFALTHPAKEVGGDFYNVFVWDDKLLFFIADVSGKGVPAALLMMKTNTLISSILKNDENPADSLIYTNKELTDHNEQGMFVTSIVGCLDLRTGNVDLANAGHNPPLLKHHSKKYEYFKLPTGFVLGGLPDTKYKNVSRKLIRNDVLFIYTDGVTEAMNETGELFGEERLQQFLNELDPSLSSEQICHAVNDEVHRFQGGANQADDITMLCLKYNDVVENSSFIVPADRNEVNRVVEFVNSFLNQFSVGQKILSQIDIAIDEICSNIFNYAYLDKNKNGTIQVDISIADNIVTIHFVDTGAPFNPLEKEDPDINLGLEERKEGGLGIFIVKQMMDSVSYRYSKNKENILTITKKVGE